MHPGGRSPYGGYDGGKGYRGKGFGKGFIGKGFVGKGFGGKGHGKGNQGYGKGFQAGMSRPEGLYRDSFVENPWRSLLPDDPLALSLCSSAQATESQSASRIAVVVGPNPALSGAENERASSGTLEEFRLAWSELTDLLQYVNSHQMAAYLLPQVRKLRDLASSYKLDEGTSSASGLQPLESSVSVTPFVDDEGGAPAKRSRISLPPPVALPSTVSSEVLMDAVSAAKRESRETQACTN